jgi:hypothetical protein
MATPTNQNNLIDVQLNPADATSAINLINQAEQLFPYLLGLTPEEKKKMQGINVSNRVFVEDCLVLMQEDTSILPPFISLQDVQNDYTLFEGLEPVVSKVAGLASKLATTQFVAGAEAYFKCLLYYNMLSLAARNGIPGAQEKYDRLKERFEIQGRTAEERNAAGSPAENNASGN